jgi:hypothetical protein
MVSPSVTRTTRPVSVSACDSESMNSRRQTAENADFGMPLFNRLYRKSFE